MTLFLILQDIYFINLRTFPGLFKKYYFQNDKGVGDLLLGTPESQLIFNMIKWVAGVGGINNFIHWSGGDVT